MAAFHMLDWQAAEGDADADKSPWQVTVETATNRVDVTAVAPDGKKREVWIEIADGNLVVHSYDPEHESPMTMRIGADTITIDEKVRDP